MWPVFGFSVFFWFFGFAKLICIFQLPTDFSLPAIYQPQPLQTRTCIRTPLKITSIIQTKFKKLCINSNNNSINHKTRQVFLKPLKTLKTLITLNTLKTPCTCFKTVKITVSTGSTTLKPGFKLKIHDIYRKIHKIYLLLKTSNLKIPTLKTQRYKIRRITIYPKTLLKNRASQPPPAFKFTRTRWLWAKWKPAFYITGPQWTSATGSSIRRLKAVLKIWSFVRVNFL